MSPRRLALLAALAGALTTTALALGHQRVGYVRDEGIYFVASRRYAAWAADLLRRPAAALGARERDAAFAINHEHPALLKLAAGVSARLLAAPTAPPPAGVQAPEPPARGVLPILPEGAAMRLPAQLLAGLGVALLVLAGAGLGGGWLAGLLAAAWFILEPRVWFHAGLHCFDVPVAVATLAVVLAYRRALTRPAWGLALGPLLGLAIAVKHNALFIPLLLGAHYYLCLLRARGPRPRATWAPLLLWSMALLAPLTAFALWPWLWSDPVGRLTDYFAFHREHSYYNTEFLGVNYNRPPLPIAYPFVLTWATVPTGLLLLALVGLALGLRRDLRRPAPSDTSTPPRQDDGHDEDHDGGRAGPAPSDTSTPRPANTRPSGALRRPPPSDTSPPRRWAAPLRAGEAHDGALLALFAAFPLALIALPTVPIFGGTKHWITAYPFLALAAALAFGELTRAAALVGRLRHLPPLALALLVGPALWATVHAHPVQLSQYAPLVGGARGAARLGLLRGFWGHALVDLLPALHAVAPRPIDLHDLHELSRRHYEREGRWPAGLTPAPTARARAALLFHERHMATYEIQQWDSLGTTAPAALIELDDVPLTSLVVAGAPLPE